MALFYGLGSTASRLEPLRGDSLLFTNKFPETTSVNQNTGKPEKTEYCLICTVLLIHRTIFGKFPTIFGIYPTLYL